MHTRRVRELDRPPPPEFSSPLHMSEELAPEDDDDGTPVNIIEITSHSLHYIPQDYKFVPPESDTTTMTSTTPHRGRSLIYDPATIHGPTLPTDEPDQLYDDWGGELGYYEANQASNPEDADDIDAEEDQWSGFQPGKTSQSQDQTQTGPLEDILAGGTSDAQFQADQQGEPTDNHIQL